MIQRKITRDEKLSASENHRVRAFAACNNLTRFGLRAQPEYDRGYTGKIVVDPEALLEVLRRMDR